MRSNLKIFFLVALVALFGMGCEGDEGPTGPAGPAGPAGSSTILAFGVVEVGASAASVRDVGPGDVTASATWSSTGRVVVTLTGDFPAGEPVVVSSASGPQGGGGGTINVATDLDCFVGNNVGSNCAADEIVFEAFITDTSNTNIDEDFSFVVFGE